MPDTPGTECATGGSIGTAVVGVGKHSDNNETHKCLIQARRDLWQLELSPMLHPLRVWLVDPTLQFWTLICRQLMTNNIQNNNNKSNNKKKQQAELLLVSPAKWDRLCYPLVRYGLVLPTVGALSMVSTTHNSSSSSSTRNTTSAAQQQTRSLDRGIRSRGFDPVIEEPQQTRQEEDHFAPPSELQSALAGAIAFGLSVTADLLGAVLDPGKANQWWSTLNAFSKYLRASGVGAELEESVLKPLWRGRLLDNIKILNDVQEMVEADLGHSTQDLNIKSTENAHVIPEASRYMRFATAAYGVEMVHSAMDRKARHTDIEDELKAIAFHCRIDDQDVAYQFVNAGGDLQSVLRHFIAVDHATRSIVFSIRGTLSISGALVDMQGMQVDFGPDGQAHAGIAEQAHLLWKESGSRLIEICRRNPQYRVVITGHSLGGGASCLLHMKIHQEELLTEVCPAGVFCYAFAPPPTYCVNKKQDATNTIPPAIRRALDTCVAVVHDHDCVPLLSVASIRRLARQMDTVDNRTEHLWFWTRFGIFWEYQPIPDNIVRDVQAVVQSSKAPHRHQRAVDGEAALEIPARLIVWLRNKSTIEKTNNVAANGAVPKMLDATETDTGGFEAFACSKELMTTASAETTSYDDEDDADTFEAFACSKEAWRGVDIFVCQDMITDHMPEAYENALDCVMTKATAQTVTQTANVGPEQ